MEIEKAYDLFDEGRLLDAQIICRDLLIADPDYFPAIYLLGTIQSEIGEYSKAIDFFSRALELRPRSETVLFNLAITLLKNSRRTDALNAINDYIELNKNDAQAYTIRSTILIQDGNLVEALEQISIALSLEPDLPEALTNQGNCLNELGRYLEAENAFTRAIELRPDYAEAHTGHGILLKKTARSEEAIDAHRRAISLKPDYAEAYSNLGVVLNELGRSEEAIDAHRRAISLKPDYAEAYSNLGVAYQEMSKFDLAKHSFEVSLEKDEEFHDARFNLALLQLLLSEFDRGWLNYEARKIKKKRIGTRGGQNISIPISRDVVGKNVLVFWEQGLGDTLQFCRYIHMLCELSDHVTFAPQDTLIKFLKPNFPNASVLSLSKVGDDFDFQIPLMSLPLLFETDTSSVPCNAFYLSIDLDQEKKWKKKIGNDGFKIGICWKGSGAYERDYLRSFSLSNFEGIARLRCVRLINLHKGDGEGELKAARNIFPVETLGAEFDEEGAFLDTAAVMQSLDLVITSDTSIAHLAGALGIKTWIILPVVPDWRWQVEGEQSLWYPTVRLFRQTTRGDWETVFKMVEAELSALISSQNSAGSSPSQHLRADCEHRTAQSVVASTSVV